MQRLPFQMIMMAQTHASDQRESEFLPHAHFLAHATATATATATAMKTSLLKSEFALRQTLSRLCNSSNFGKFLFGVEF